MTKPKCRSIIFIVLMALILIVRNGRAEIDIINCSSDIYGSVKIYRAEYPIAMEGYSLAASSATPVPSDNTVTIIFDGIIAGVVCNNTWHNLSSSSGEPDLKNTIRCRVSGDRQTIEMDLEI